MAKRLGKGFVEFFLKSDQFKSGAKGMMNWRSGKSRNKRCTLFRRTGRECVIYVGSEGSGAAWTIMIRPVIMGVSR